MSQISDLICLLLVFIVNFVHLELFFFTLYLFKKIFTPECINHTCLLSSLEFLASKMGLTTLLAQLFSTFFRIKLWRVVMKCKNVFLNFRALFLLKMFTFEVQVSFQSINQSALIQSALIQSALIQSIFL